MSPPTASLSKHIFFVMACYRPLSGQSREINGAKNSEGLNMELNIKNRIINNSFHSSRCWQKNLEEKQMKPWIERAQLDGAILIEKYFVWPVSRELVSH